MAATTTAQKPQAATRRRAERARPSIEGDPVELNLGLLLDPRRLSQPAVCELLRIAAGLSYRDLAELTGIPRAHLLKRVLRGLQANPRRDHLDLIRDACWERIARRPQNAAARYLPDLLTLEEAARLLAVRPVVMRRLALKHPELGAIKVGRQIRFPSRKLAAFISRSERPAGSQSDSALSTVELARALRVTPDTIRYFREAGRIRSFRSGRGRGRGFRVPLSEVRRVMREGTSPLRPRQSDPPGKRRSRGGRER